MANEIERVNYFDHQFLTLKDFTDEQNYHIQMRELQNKYTFSAGIVDGLRVRKNDCRSVIVDPGMAIDERGRAIIVSEALPFTIPQNTTPQYVYLTLDVKDITDPLGRTVRIQQRPEVTPNAGSQAIRLAGLKWTGEDLEDCDLSARQKATAKGVDLTPFVRKTGETEAITGRLNVGGATPDNQDLMRNNSNLKFFVKGNVAIEGNLLVSSKIYTADSTPNEALGSVNLVGSDLAEVYASRMSLESGEVVCLHPDDDSIVRSTVPNDPLVFGVISTAPAHVLGKANGLGFPVALTGRVPCKVVAENGPIRRGDLLTTSTTPGHAMKATPVVGGSCGCLPPGTIMGKALGALPAGVGLIEVFVFLR